MKEKVHQAMFLLQKDLYLTCKNNIPIASQASKESLRKRRSELINLIESVVLNLMKAMKNGEPIQLTFRSLSWHNTNFSDRVEIKDDASLTKVRLSHFSSRSKFLLMVRVLEKAHELLRSESTVTQRELYYQLMLDKERALTDAVRGVCSMISAAPWELGILSTSKGLVSGPLIIHLADGEVTNCAKAKEGVMIPANIAQLSKLESEAKFVLLVEKDAIFQKLLVDENIQEHLGPLIIVTGKGFPDIGTRQLIHGIWGHLGLPILILVDADPHGIEIMCVYRFGSLSKSELPDLPVPSVRWIGIHPTDISNLIFPQDCLAPLTDGDRKKAENLLTRPFIAENSALKREIEELLKNGKKAEIESVGRLRKDYLTDILLPIKISSMQYI